ncbi:MAG: class I SAM-dependent methyltransferase [bacterium]|nr:class I SAM-dependent methyltransferase [bacterium]
MNDTHDTGTTLRLLYAAEGGVRSVFSTKVADYVTSRPDYPSALYEALRAICPPTDGVTVADIGAGTGLLTQGLLRRGYRVVAVEPNPDMRQASDILLGKLDGYRSVDGCAESIPLGSGSVQLITAAQAFQWFDADRARAEFLRVLTPEGQVALIWNDRIRNDPLNLALDEVFRAYGGAKREALAAHENRSNLPRFFGATWPKEFSWPHKHHLDEDGLLSLVFSRSYIPGRPTNVGREIAAQVREVFRRLVADGTVEVRYQTVATVGRPE